MSDTILQRHLPDDMRQKRALPGIAPETGPWLRVDEAYGGQMARRRALLDTRRDDVLYLEEGARGAAQELLALVLDRLPSLGFEVGPDAVLCPDGRKVVVSATDPLGTLGALVQADFCVLQKRGHEHVLTGAVLCFPASWMLSEKAGRPLGAIHDPVEEYDDNIARRVQRLFDGVRVGRPIWRFNALWYADAELHQPRSAHARRPERYAAAAEYYRSERQTLLRLPESDAVVFVIHTYVLAGENVR